MHFHQIRGQTDIDKQHLPVGSMFVRSKRHGLEVVTYTNHDILDGRALPDPPQRFEQSKIGEEDLGDQPRIAPDGFAWICNICNKAKFRTFDEAVEHENTCADIFYPKYVLLNPLAINPTSS